MQTIIADSRVIELNHIAAYKKGEPIVQAEQLTKPFHWNPIDSDWKKSLKERWWATNYQGVVPEEQTKLLPLRDKLLSFGGEEVCLPAYEEDLERLLADGQFWYGDRVIKMQGLPNQCHSNSSNCWDVNRDKIVLCTGYGLSKDGMWRQHSFCIKINPKRNYVVETTVDWVGYFGFVMNLQESESFVFNNL